MGAYNNKQFGIAETSRRAERWAHAPSHTVAKKLDAAVGGIIGIVGMVYTSLQLVLAPVHVPGKPFLMQGKPGDHINMKVNDLNAWAACSLACASARMHACMRHRHAGKYHERTNRIHTTGTITLLKHKVSTKGEQRTLC